MAQVELNGRDLDIATARRIVLDGAEVCIAREAEEAMARGRAIVGRYVDEGIAAYGVTTGLGRGPMRRCRARSWPSFRDAWCVGGRKGLGHAWTG